MPKQVGANAITLRAFQAAIFDPICEDVPFTRKDAKKIFFVIAHQENRLRAVRPIVSEPLHDAGRLRSAIDKVSQEDDVGFAGGARGAVLLSPMMPFEPDRLPDLAGRAVFIGAGRADSIAPAVQAERLAEVLRQSGADVAVHWHPGGHAVTPGEMEAARRWIEQRVTMAARRPEREAGAR